ncbi:MAG: hypothetical protein LVQ97_00920 [Candidatus Micrarchaeales archaeon]|nr:hypothetical protein [Candidatus Micrarchaeales archaeon]
MSKEEIEAAKKKLGLDKPKKVEALGLCQANNCSKPATKACKYCRRFFCEVHSKPRLAISPNYIWSIDKSDAEKFNKYNEDWQAKDGHTCLEYTKEWNDNHEKSKAEEYKKINSAYDSLFSRRQNNTRYKRNYGNQSTERSYAKHAEYDRHTRKINKAYLSFFYDEQLLKKALIFSIIITMLDTFPLGLISMGRPTPNIGVLFESKFVIDFVVIFVIFAVYRKVAARQLSYWTGMTIGIISAVILLDVINFTQIVSVPDFIVVLLALFILSYAGILVGKGLNGRAYGNKRRAMVYLGKAILIVLGIIILADSSLLALNFIKTGAILGSNAYNITNILHSGVGDLNNIENSTRLAPINSTWATAFFRNVSKRRGETYNYCANLSDFAKIRFNTMVQDYGISHYGYAEDFNRTWPNGVRYGDEIYQGFGEEVFYPVGYTPSNYVQYIIAAAPLHWQELIDTNLTAYGYYIGNGPAYEILGPNGGYTECPVTEIPGPNINISQYFAGYGCSVEVANLTYFVIELAPFCPPIG